MIGQPTWKEVMDVKDLHKHGGFKDRNTLVANAADVFLAMTFGNKREVRDGGTKDTVIKMLERPSTVTGYHLDLNTCKLYEKAF